MIDVKLLQSRYAECRDGAFAKRVFSPAEFHAALDALARQTAPLCSVEEIGRSHEGRPLRLVSAGEGKTTVFFWSQMHGDESTATMAILDILRFLALTKAEPETGRILRSVRLLFLPMLNPDGAERFQRRTAQQIDMNRDARALVTPEARLLKETRDRFSPAFGFNLHDQELSTVGTTKELSAIALLAPAMNPAKEDNGVRVRAKRVASVFAETMHAIVPGKVSRYDDTFEPRAFGDMMQSWGTSTVLVESGHATGDPEKNRIRMLNAVGLLAAVSSIADGTYAAADTGAYESLPFNGKRAYDLIIRKAAVEDRNGKKTTVDLGVSWQVDTHAEEPPRLVDMGDLSTFAGVREVSGEGVTLPLKEIGLNKPFDWERYFPGGRAAGQ
jgi:hypothetical protein